MLDQIPYLLCLCILNDKMLMSYFKGFYTSNEIAEYLFSGNSPLNPRGKYWELEALMNLLYKT